MVLFAVMGKLGSGKTLFITREAYHYATKGYTIYTNYHLIGIKHKRLKSPEHLLQIGLKKNPIKKAVFLDEGYLWFDALTKNVERQKFYRNLINITRKMGLVVFITTQSLGQINLRTRMLFDAFFEPHMYHKGKRYVMKVNISQSDYYNGFMTLKTYWIKNVNRYFQYYDTLEIINDFVKDYVTPEIPNDGLQTSLNAMF